MRSTFAAIVVAATFVFMSAVSAEACSRNVSSESARTVVPTKGINQAMLSKAIRVEVNFHRCRAGLDGVGAAGGDLRKQALGHSGWMAKFQQLTHRSTVSGAATLKQRIQNAGLRIRAGSENIGMVHRYQIDNVRFKIVDSGSCSFASSDGTKLPAHTYATLARHIVNLWMNSPGHRKNILDRKVNRMTSAAAFDPKANYGGRFWVTQNFIG